MGNIYISTSCLKGTDARFEKKLSRVLEVYGKEGIQNIELGAAMAYPADLKQAYAYQKKYDAHYIIHGLFPPIEKPLFLNFALDNDLTKQSITVAKKAIDICRMLGGDLYSFHPGYLADILLDDHHTAVGEFENPDKAFENAIYNIGELSDFAKEKGVRLAIENTPRDNPANMKAMVFNSADALKRLLKGINSKDVGLLLDVGHLRLEKLGFNVNEKDFLDKLGNKIFELHVHSVVDGKDHNIITSTDVLAHVDKSILKRAYVTLESNFIEPGQFKPQIDILKKSIL